MSVLNQSRVAVFGSVREAEVAWRALEPQASATPFQSYRWQEAWSRTAGAARGERPVIVVVYDRAGTPQLLLPFAAMSFQGALVLGWQGQDHATYAMGLYAPGAAERIGADDLSRLIEAIRDQVPEISALHLTSQPAVWRGVANPFALLGAQDGASRSYQLTLEADFDAQMQARLKKDTRGKLRRAATALGAVPGFATEAAATPAERLALLDSFFAQKARQLAARGIPNPFEKPGIAAFYRDLAGSVPGSVPLLDCHALSVDGAVLATATSIHFQDQRHLLTLSLGSGDPGLLKHSPGLVLMRHLMATAAKDGTALYDFGAGDGQHKSIWHPEAVVLFETHLPLSLRGYAVSLAAASGSAVKRLIKNNQTLWQAAKSARRLLRASRG